ncbi:hypothetical protein WA158_007557 [Blastocystis sp. Blastoise]
MDVAFSKCSELLKKISAIEEAGNFLEPVPWKEWGLVDYPKIIKQPMDLGTVSKKLSNGEYKDIHEFAFDMRLIWRNCMTYNDDESDIYADAKSLSKQFEEGFAQIAKEVGIEDVKEISITEKQKFTESLYTLSSEDLGKLMQLLEEKCPKCITKNSWQELELSIDDIDTTAFKLADTFIKETSLKSTTN